eukprot:g30674.t1
MEDLNSKIEAMLTSVNCLIERIDRPVPELREQLRCVVEISRRGHLEVNLSNGNPGDSPNAEFENEDDATEILQDIADLWKMFKVPVLVEGHTKDIGSGTDQFWQEVANSRAALCAATLGDARLMIPFMIVPLGFAAMIGIWFVPLTMDDTPFPQFAGAIVAFATILVVSVGRLIVVTKNTAEDQKIHQLCSELTTATQGAIQVQYRTAWTGFCKPKHARTARLIVFCPRTSMGPVTIPIPGAAPIQSIMITVPPGVVPGQQLQVQTPTGIQTATVPEGSALGSSVASHPFRIPDHGGGRGSQKAYL